MGEATTKKKKKKKGQMVPKEISEESRKNIEKVKKAKKLKELKEKYRKKRIKGSIGAREYVKERLKLMDEEEVSQFESKKKLCKQLNKEMKQFSTGKEGRSPWKPSSIEWFLKKEADKGTEVGEKAEKAKAERGGLYG